MPAINNVFHELILPCFEIGSRAGPNRVSTLSDTVAVKRSKVTRLWKNGYANYLEYEYGNIESVPDLAYPQASLDTS